MALKLQSCKKKKRLISAHLLCFQSILKILHSNFLPFCSNLPMKFTIFFKKVVYFLTVSVASSVYEQNFPAQ